MRGALLFCFLLSLSFSLYIGDAVSQMEKTWHLSSPETIREVKLNGTFIAMSEFQEVRSLEVSEGARFEQAGNEIFVIFEAPEFSGEKNITATATVHTAYPLDIESDPPFRQGLPRPAPGLIAYNDAIYSTAAQIAEGKEGHLEVISALAEWTNRYVNYNLSYWGSPAPATEVFQNPQAVCVGYTHLFIAMARSLGFETRFVSGYAFAGEWQAHAWAEVRVGNRWIPVDPTFGEMGILDARHVATSYSDDQGEVYDSLLAKGGGFNFSSNVSVGTSEEHIFQKFFSVHTILFGDGLEVVIYNPTDFYATPTYTMDMPDYILPDDKRILVIPPRSSVTIRYSMNTAELEPGYTHEIPYEIKLQGATFSDELSYVKGVPRGLSPPPLIQQSPAPQEEAPCPLLLVFALAIFAFSIFFWKKEG